MTDVHIVGAGIHAFGRHDDKTGLDQGVLAVREALADAGLAWSDVQFGFGASEAAGNADAVLPRLGLTGIQFINVKNGCAAGGSALLSGYWAIKSGEFDLGVVVGFDKHPRGAFNPNPSDWGLPEWYGDIGLMLTTQFFGNKINRYMSLNGISATTLGRVAEKAFENGTKTPHAWRSRPKIVSERYRWASRPAAAWSTTPSRHTSSESPRLHRPYSLRRPIFSRGREIVRGRH